MSNLSIKLTTPHQSDAPFVGERVFQNRGVCGKRSLLSPPAPPSLVLFALAPFSARPECENSFSRPDISFGSYGNACYAGNQNLYRPSSRINYGLARFRVVESQTWETIPTVVMCLPYSVFKKKYRLFLLDSQT